MRPARSLMQFDWKSIEDGSKQLHLFSAFVLFCVEGFLPSNLKLLSEGDRDPLRPWQRCHSTDSKSMYHHKFWEYEGWITDSIDLWWGVAHILTVQTMPYHVTFLHDKMRCCPTLLLYSIQTSLYGTYNIFALSYVRYEHVSDMCLHDLMLSDDWLTE